MQTAIVGTSTVSIKTEDADGVATTPGTVTVTGTAHDGTTVTLSAVTIGSGPTAGTHTATLTISQPTQVTLTWTVNGVAFTDLVDVLGRMPISVSELRAADSTLTSTVTYPGSVLRDAIEVAHDEARRITGRSWVRRYDVDTFRPRNGCIMTQWADIARVGAVTVDGVAWTTQQITDGVDIEPQSGAVWLSTWSDEIVELGVEHGQREPSPLVRLAMLTRARQFAQSPTSKVGLYSERVVIGSDGGSIVRMLPKINSTGIAEVDAAYHGAAWAGAGFA